MGNKLQPELRQEVCFRTNDLNSIKSFYVTGDDSTDEKDFLYNSFHTGQTSGGTAQLRLYLSSVATQEHATDAISVLDVLAKIDQQRADLGAISNDYHRLITILRW